MYLIHIYFGPILPNIAGSLGCIILLQVHNQKREKNCSAQVSFFIIGFIGQGEKHSVFLIHFFTLLHMFVTWLS